MSLKGDEIDLNLTKFLVPFITAFFLAFSNCQALYVPQVDLTQEIQETNVILGDKPPIDINDAYYGNFENYSNLDELGRCGQAYSNVCIELMPILKRESIGQVKPSGWQTKKYDFVKGKYLYNRCHLIAFQLAGENANPKNLITGTRYLNNELMLPIENKVAKYIKRTNNHVLYRVTPVFADQDLVARGVIIEALSVEDNGEGISIYVFLPNVQPGVEIDYATGNSKEITYAFVLIKRESLNALSFYFLTSCPFLRT